MSLTAVLISSPFLAPAVWEPVAEALRDDLGADSVLPAPPVPPAADPAVVLGALREALPSRGDLVLVPHSNAGLYVPALLQAPGVRGAVFVDAVLPPSGGEVSVAPEGMRAQLSGLVDGDGLLPPWTGWWPEEDVAALFPDNATRQRVAAQQQRVPFAYLTARVTVPDGWDRFPAAYLAFGDTYGEELAQARSRGWPTHALAGGHLHMVCAPRAVAAAIMRLAARF